MTNQFRADAQILKVSTEMGLIFGFALICKDNGEDYYDTDGDHFTEQGMLEASTDFAKSERMACSMHARDEGGAPIQDGGVVHHFPLTTEIAKALGIQTRYTGLLIALAPDNPETLEKARNGDFTGFSIAGDVIEATDE